MQPPPIAASLRAPERTARATLFALTATALEKGGAMAVLLLIARLLGPKDFGRYAALMALLALFQLAAELGQEPILVRQLAARRADEAPELIQGALAARLAWALVAGGLMAAVGTGVFPELGPAPVLLAAAGLVAAAGLGLRAFFRTTGRLESLCLLALANVGTFAVVVVVLHAFGLGVAAAVGGWAAGQLAASLAAFALAARHVVPWPRWHAPVAVDLARAGWVLALNGVLLTVTLRIGQIIVIRLDGAQAAGYLAAGSRLAEAFALIPEAVMLALLPVLSAHGSEERASQRELAAQLVRVLVLAALPVVLMVAIGAPQLLALLFGPAYVAGAPALRLLAWLALLAASGTVFTNLLIARRLESLLLAIGAIGSLLTIGLSLLAVPRVGFVGAALATLLASVLSQAALLAIPATREDVAICLKPLRGPIALAAALAAAGMAAPGPPLVIAGAAVLVFGGVLFATGVVRGADFAVLRRALVPRP